MNAVDLGNSSFLGCPPRSSCGPLLSPLGTSVGSTSQTSPLCPTQASHRSWWRRCCPTARWWELAGPRGLLEAPPAPLLPALQPAPPLARSQPDCRCGQAEKLQDLWKVEACWYRQCLTWPFPEFWLLVRFTQPLVQLVKGQRRESPAQTPWLSAAATAIEVQGSWPCPAASSSFHSCFFRLFVSSLLGLE